MASPIVPFYGKDVDKLAMLNLACKAMAESNEFLKDWPTTVITFEKFKQKIDLYQTAYEMAIHYDRRAIASRIAAGNEAGAAWQKIVNYACATEQDHSEMLERMGVSATRRTSKPHAPSELHAPDLSVVNLDVRGSVRASCAKERRRYTYEIWITEGDPRVEEGWYLKQSFGDGSMMDIPGLISGKEYSFRCRIIGRDNTIGPWSHTITLMVT
jgi:hypothetical protein